jgi:hypothetical protein
MAAILQGDEWLKPLGQTPVNGRTNLNDYRNIMRRHEPVVNDGPEEREGP